MPIWKRGLLLLLLAPWPCATQAQDSARRPGGEYAWTPIMEHESVRFSYLFYRHADEKNGGLVLRLINANPYAVDYRFTIVFRSEGAETEEAVRGSLMAGQMKTGTADGLFWIPFDDGRGIDEVGLRGYRITRRAEPPEK